MPRLLGLLPALVGAAPASDATPAYGLRGCLDTLNPPAGHGCAARFDRDFYLAGTPEIEPRLLARPLVLGSITGTRLDFDRDRHLITRESH